jgi:hypothetical protein
MDGSCGSFVDRIVMWWLIVQMMELCSGLVCRTIDGTYGADKERCECSGLISHCAMQPYKVSILPCKNVPLTVSCV